MKKGVCTIKYSGKSATGKTKIWKVLDLHGVEIGYIKWYGAWRCYVYEPLAYTVYEWNCQRFIADVCETESKKARQGWARKKK